MKSDWKRWWITKACHTESWQIRVRVGVLNIRHGQWKSLWKMLSFVLTNQRVQKHKHSQWTLSRAFPRYIWRMKLVLGVSTIYLTNEFSVGRVKQLTDKWVRLWWADVSHNYDWLIIDIVIACLKLKLWIRTQECQICFIYSFISGKYLNISVSTQTSFFMSVPLYTKAPVTLAGFELYVTRYPVMHVCTPISMDTVYRTGYHFLSHINNRKW